MGKGDKQVANIQFLTAKSEKPKANSELPTRMD